MLWMILAGCMHQADLERIAELEKQLAELHERHQDLETRIDVLEAVPMRQAKPDPVDRDMKTMLNPVKWLVRSGEVWTIQGALVPDEFGALGRLILHRGASGEMDGFRLSAIRRGTALDALGIKNGDILHELNGAPLYPSLEEILQSLQRIRAEKPEQVTVKLTRRGEIMEVTAPIHW
jgi:type II secretory pathway component PulC